MYRLGELLGIPWVDKVSNEEVRKMINTAKRN